MLTATHMHIITCVFVSLLLMIITREPIRAYYVCVSVFKRALQYFLYAFELDSITVVFAPVIICSLITLFISVFHSENRPQYADHRGV